MASAKDLLRMLDDPSFGQASQAENARKLLEKLDAAGELRPAEQEALNALREAQPATDDAMGQTGAAYRGALQGATFQQADEILGLFGGDKEGARIKNLEAEIAYPDQYNRGKLGGAVLTGAATAAATAPLATGMTLLGTMGRGAALGFGEGFAWGTGGAEGADKLPAGARQGAINAGIGFAAPLAVAGGARVVRAGDDLVRGALGFGNEARAGRSVLAAADDAGRPVPALADDVARAAREGQPDFRLMDALGIPGQRKASGVVRSGGPGADELANFLRQRQMDAPDRMGGFVDDAFGTGGTTAAQTREALTAQRTQTADAMYSQARQNAQPVDVRNAVAVIDQRIAGMQGSNITGDGIDAKLAQFRRRLMADPAPSGTLSVELSDFDRVLGVKQDVQDAIGAAVRSGRNNEARELGKLVRELDAALETSSDAYRFANDNFRDASRVIDAVDTGAQMAVRGRAADNVPTFQGMPPQQQQSARIGYGDQLLTELERNRARAPDVSRLVTSTKRRAESDAMALDPRLFADRVAREGQMYETFNRALGGSRTADNLADQADVGAIADAARAARDVSTGNVVSALSNVGNAVGRRLTGQNEATRQIVAQLLMSDNPAQALQSALRNQKISENTKRVIEAIIRAGGRTAVPQ